LLVRTAGGTFDETSSTGQEQEAQAMEDVSSQVLPAVHHLKFLIFDWSLPNVIMGVIVIALFFLGAWARLPKWIERGRDRAKGGRK
jgi:protein-S-isoprenylcysteine O-methyltransferase Ste14